MSPQGRVRILRTVDAPLERVFRAFTDPDEVVRWWGPAGIATSVAEIDLVVGGRCRWVMHPQGTTAVLHGVITELEPPVLLAMTNQWEGNPNESLVTFRFGAVDQDMTRIEITHELLPADVPPADYEDGWSAALDSLQAHVADQKGGNDGND